MLGLIDGDVLLHSSLWQTTNERGVRENIDRNIREWTDGAFCDDAIIALGAEDGKCYRDDLFPLYKKSPSRVKGRKKRLDHTAAAKEYISGIAGCIMVDNIEADDLLGHWATQLRGESVVISVDKDLRQMEGTFYNPHKRVDGVYVEEYAVISEEGGNLFFLEQLLSGDAMDHIPGLPGVGPITAKKLLAETDTPAAMVIDKYKEKFGDEWESYFLINGKLLFIQREPDQHFTFSLFEEMFNVNIARV